MELRRRIRWRECEGEGEVRDAGYSHVPWGRRTATRLLRTNKPTNQRVQYSKEGAGPPCLLESGGERRKNTSVI